MGANEFQFRHMAIAPGNLILQTDMAALAALANSKTSLQTLSGTHYPYSFPEWSGVSRQAAENPDWLTTLNHLGADLYAVINPTIQGSVYTPDVGIAQWVYDSISGGTATANKVAGWPIGSPTVYNKNLAFWYLDNGTNQYANLTCTDLVICSGTFTTSIYESYVFESGTSSGQSSFQAGAPPIVFNQSAQAYPTQTTFQIIVGGDAPLLIQGDFYIVLSAFRGATWTYLDGGVYVAPTNPLGAACPLTSTTYITVTPDTGAVPLPTVDWGGLPGTAQLLYPSSWGDTRLGYYESTVPVYAVLHVDGLVDPGTYTIVVTSALPTDSFTSSGNYLLSTTQGSATFINWSTDHGPQLLCAGYNSMTSYPPSPSGNLEASIQLGPGLSAPGISSSQNVLKIDCSGFYADSQPTPFPIGVWSVINAENDSSAWFYPPFPQPTFNPAQYENCTISLSTTTTGFWTGNTPPINAVEVVTPSEMPWNLQVHYIYETGVITMNPMLLSGETQPVNSYAQNVPCEQQSEPPGWKALATFTVGFVIVDSNGNFQRALNNMQISGTSQPSWKIGQGATTSDGGVLWECIRVNSSPVLSADHRPVCVPRYPIYWTSETESSLIPPSSLTSEATVWGCGNQWYNSSFLYEGITYATPGFTGSNLALGWWIYSISLNRLGTTMRGDVLLPPSSQVSVTIGCLRNGSFVAFGTYETGQTIQVLWPIFTSNALVYECSERVDIQAVAFVRTNPGSFGSLGYPLAAQSVLDIITGLGLIT